jgi:hypothetical protein
LGLDSSGQILELGFHVDCALAANWTFIRGFHVLVVASLMNAVATEHEDNGSGGCKHILSADGAIAVGDSLDAFVRVLHRHGHTSTTSLCS